MKKNRLLIPFLFIFSFLLSACYFVADSKIGFSIRDSVTKYFIGQIFANENKMEVQINYESGLTKATDEYTYTVINEKTNSAIDPNEPFTEIGNYKVVVSYDTFKDKSYLISVIQSENAKGISLSLDEVTLNVYETLNLSYCIFPQDTQTQDVTYFSDDTSICQVTNTGLINAKSEGETNITVKLNGTDCFDTCIVKVISSTISKTKILQTYEDYAAHHPYSNVSYSPTIRDVKSLIIPIWFTDSYKYISESKKDLVREDIITVYTGNKDEIGWHSVRSFYEQESFSKLRLDANVTQWYEPNKPSTYYYTDNSGLSLGETGDKVGEIVEEATNAYFERNPQDSRTNYDLNNDGFLDSVILIYGSPNYQSLGNEFADNMWAFFFGIQATANKVNPVVCSYFWASYDFMYGHNKAYERTGNKYSAGNTTYCTLDAHTYIHEMGHMLGLEDYYDYVEGGYVPGGGFSMQDYNVGGHDPYSVMALGWANPYIPTSSTSIKLYPFQESHQIILLTPEFNSYKSAFDEYLLLELYTPTGLNKFDVDHTYEKVVGVKDIGIRLWHIDSRLTYYSSNSSLSYNLTSNTKTGRILHAMSNSSGGSYASPLADDLLHSEYYDYRIMHLIRNNTNISFNTSANFNENDLFRDGSSFNISNFYRQFVNGTKLNSGSSFPWSFSVSISDSGEDTFATVDLVRN